MFSAILRTTYPSRHAIQDIISRKAHRLRSVRQDKARTDILLDLDETSVLITQDWAMKFLPLKYRKSDWFGKRGISWHISVVAWKKEGVMICIVYVVITLPVACIYKGNHASEVEY